MPSMYNPQYSARGPQYFYQQPCSQAIPPGPAQLPRYPEANSELNLGSFSSGSSLQYNDHACLPATIGPSTGPSSILTNTHATGPTITETPADVLGYSQPIQNPQLSWRLHPAQAYAQTTPVPFHLNASPAPNRNKRTSRSRADNNPMAVLLPPEDPSPPLPLPFAHNAETASHQSAAILSAFALDTEASGQVSSTRVLREKKHACWMCHKSFDRPSTLRKHLLVHTGEKAFVCETCGRRFGVASNLNRHVRRCILRPVNTANTPRTRSSNDSSDAQAFPTSAPTVSSSASPSPAAPSAQSTTNTSPSTNGKTDPMPTNKRRNKRSSPSSPSPPQSQASNATEAQPHSHSSPGTTQKTFKRRRRAPSPSRWIPFSLLAFDLSPIELHKSTPVPLPPVTPASVRTVWSEERNSWDENVGVAPYDRYEYKGVLPGPGLGLSSGTGFGGRDVGNLGGGGSFIMGRLVLA